MIKRLSTPSTQALSGCRAVARALDHTMNFLGSQIDRSASEYPFNPHPGEASA